MGVSPVTLRQTRTTLLWRRSAWRGGPGASRGLEGDQRDQSTYWPFSAVSRFLPQGGGQLVNTHVEAAFQERNRGIEHLKAEILRLEREAGNLVRFLAEGGESTSVRSELQGIESALQGLRLELAGREAMPSVPPRVHPTWMRAKLERLDELLRQEPAQAKAEIAKHLDGELTVRPLPSTGRERRAEIRGRAKLNSLLERQEAVCGEVVAGAGFEPATFGL